MNILRNINAILSASLDQDNELEYKIKSEKEVQQMFMSDYNEAYNFYMKTNKPILRGLKHIHNEIFVTKPKIRTSIMTSNVYTSLISDFFDSWVVYPKRNRSFICSFSFDTAHYYADSNGIYAIFPKNGANIGISSAYDFWFSFPFAQQELEFDGLNRFNEIIHYMFYRLVKVNDMVEFKDAFKYSDKNKIIYYFDLLADELSKMDEETYKAIPMIKYLHDQKPSDGRDIIKILNYCFDPDKNKFINCDMSDLYKYYSDRAKNELWTDSECLFINIDEPIIKEIFPNLIIGMR